MRTPKILPPLTIALIVALAGCHSQKAPPPIEQLSLSQAQEEYIRICKEEFGLDVKLFSLPNTLWIYLPLAEPYVLIQASATGPLKLPHASSTYVIKYLDGMFQPPDFLIQYDISPESKYIDDKGYSTKFTESFQKAQNNLFTALSRAYPQDKQIVDANGQPQKLPQFVVIVIADITTGIETKVLMDFDDYKRALRDAAFSEEYRKRVIVEQPVGFKAIIGDTYGIHLELHDLTLPEFLARQIAYRIEFQYQRSSFPPTEPPEETIRSIAATVLHYYDYRDFQTLKLLDLATGQEKIYTREELEEFAEK